MAGEGGEIPEIRKPDLQMLLQDHAELRRAAYDERREKEKMVAAVREQARWETERVRTEFTEKLKRAERENDALIVALGRLRDENDHLREEVATLKLLAMNGHIKEPKSQEMVFTSVSHAIAAAAAVPPPMVIPDPLYPKLGKQVPVELHADPTLGKAGFAADTLKKKEPS